MTFASDGELPKGYATEKTSDLSFEFINGRAASVELLETDGKISVYRILANLYVPVDLRRYPFDRQAITIQLEDKRRRDSEIRFSSSPQDTGLDEEVVIIGWTPQPLKGEYRNHVYPDGVFHQCQFTIPLERTGITAPLRVFVPLFCFLVVSFITLMLTPESYDKRLGTNTGMLIAAVMFHVAVITSLPPLGYLTLADRMVMATYVTIGFHVLQCVRMQRAWVQGAKDSANAVHRASRWAVPLLAAATSAWAVASSYL